ncbi:MAG: hypothetical protein Q7T03_00340 [Deltaproteobacteria bacterium]|nr:hypothetical protein [Deltaproteobacteria bacterium]
MIFVLPGMIPSVATPTLETIREGCRGMVNSWTAGPEALAGIVDELAIRQSVGEARLLSAYQNSSSWVCEAVRRIGFHPNIFFGNLDLLARSPMGAERLAQSFEFHPIRFVEAVVSLKTKTDSFLDHLRPDGFPDVGALMNAGGYYLFFCPMEVADFNSMRGYIRVSGLQPDSYDLLYLDGAHVSPSHLGRWFSPDEVGKRAHGNKKKLDIRFGDSMYEWSRGTTFLPHDPYKYYPFEEKKSDSRDVLREQMGLKKRDVILVHCPSSEEMEIVIQAAGRLKRGIFNSATRPLVILGLRMGDANLWETLTRRTGLRVLSRESLEEPLSEIGQQDILVLNTAGEMNRFMAVADVAIVGHDRNLFEAAWQGVPSLFFDGSWEKNSTARMILEKEGGARVVDAARLDRQIKNILQEPEHMRLGAARAVAKLKNEILPAAGLYDALRLAGLVLNRK